MQYILSETEYAALQSRITDLESTNSTLTTELLKAGHKLDVAAEVREADRAQIASQSQEIDNFKKEIVKANSMLHSAKRDMDGMEKRLSDLSDQLAYFRDLAEDRYRSLQKVTEERNALQESLAKAQKRIEHSEHLSERREVVAILRSKRGYYGLATQDKVGAYQLRGWEVVGMALVPHSA